MRSSGHRHDRHAHSVYRRTQVNRSATQKCSKVPRAKLSLPHRHAAVLHTAATSVPHIPYTMYSHLIRDLLHLPHTIYSIYSIYSRPFNDIPQCLCHRQDCNRSDCSAPSFPRSIRRPLARACISPLRLRRRCSERVARESEVPAGKHLVCPPSHPSMHPHSAVVIG